MLITEIARRLLAAVDRWTTPTPREKRSGVSSPDPWLVDLMGGPKSTSGVSVNEDSALTYAAVWRAVSILSTTIAGLPIKVLEENDAFPIERRDVPAYRVLKKRFNPIMTAFQGRMLMTRNLVTWGNGYAEIVRDGASRVSQLWPMLPKYVEVDLNARNELIYTYRLPNEKPVTLRGENVLHIKGLGGNGLTGQSVIRTAAESLGNGMAADQFAGHYFGQGMNIGAVLEHPGKLGEKAQARLRENVERLTSGLDNSHRMAILEEGMKLVRNEMPLDDAQLLETRHFGVEEVSRWFGVPQHMLSELGRATWSNIGDLKIEFVEYGLLPWLLIWETECNEKLFGTESRDRLYVKHIVEGLLRGDPKARAEFYAKAQQSGWMNPDEIRAKEDLPPLPDGQGTIYLVQSSLVPLATIGDEPAPEPEPTPEPEDEPTEEEENARQRAAEAQASVLADAARRMLYADGKAAIRRAKDGCEGFLAWLDGWGTRRGPAITAAFGPACDVIGTARSLDGLALAKALAGVHVARSVGDLGKVARAATDATLQDMVTELVGAWPETRAEAFATEAIGAHDA